MRSDRFSTKLILIFMGSLALALTCGSGTLLALTIRTESAGWATFGQALPQGYARDGLKVGNAATQTDVKSRWPDGSIKFAVVTARVPAGGPHNLSAGPASGAPFSSPLVPRARVQLNIGGTLYTAAAPAQLTGDAWLNGDQVREARAVVTPTAPGPNPHPFLRVYFDIRVYRDGQARVDVTVENCLNQFGATSVRYNVDIFVNDQLVYQHADVPHYYMTRWRQVFGVNFEYADATPDIAALTDARAMPKYFDGITTEVMWTPTPDQNPDFDILGKGGVWDPDMAAHSGRAELGPYPEWVGRYMAHPHPGQKQYVLKNGDLAGSWPMHLREPDGELTTIDQYPDNWFYRDLVKGSPVPYIPYTYAIPQWPYSPYSPDMAHTPSLAMAPCVIAGDRYYAEEVAFWAEYVLLASFQDVYYNSRGGGHYQGPGSNTPINPGSHGFVGRNENRDFAWDTRLLADAAYILPDADLLKAHFTQKLLNNLRWADQHAEYGPQGLGVAWNAWSNEDSIDPQFTKVWIRLWTLNYAAWAIQRANHMGFQGGMAWARQIARFQIEFLLRYPDSAAPYLMPIGDQVPPGSGNIVFYSQWNQVYDGNPTPYRGLYGIDARLMTVLGIEEGIPGAQQAYDYIHAIMLPDFRSSAEGGNGRSAGWGIMPLISSPEGPPRFIQGPQDVTINDGQNATFAVIAVGNPGPTLQWERSLDGGNAWAPIPGATGASYTLTAARVADSGTLFRCVAENARGTEISSPATLTVGTPGQTPRITQQPRSLSVNRGSNATFTVGATGSLPLRFEWQRSNDRGVTFSPISGAPSSASYTLFNTQPSDDAARFRCLVRNELGEAISNSATLEVRGGGGGSGDSGPNDRQLVISPNPFQPAQHGETEISNGVPDSEINIVDRGGRSMNKLRLNSSGAATWDGRDRNKRPVPSGVYSLIAPQRSRGALVVIR